jgi:predicted hotdog family 3-hydroxylacyl-ACP dehydratase
MNDFPAIAELIPHTGPMILLDRVIAFDEDSLSAELVVRSGLFGDDRTVPAWVGIEYMAQTIGAYAGMKARLAGEPIRLGFLLGTRRYSGNAAEFKVGTALTVHVEKIMQDDRLGAFECRIMGDGIEISANLNVYQPPLNDTEL